MATGLPSGERNRRTGETPCDNFICAGCQRGERALRESGDEKHRTAAQSFAIRASVRWGSGGLESPNSASLTCRPGFPWESNQGNLQSGELIGI